MKVKFKNGLDNASGAAYEQGFFEITTWSWAAWSFGAGKEVNYELHDWWCISGGSGSDYDSHIGGGDTYEVDCRAYVKRKRHED